MVEYLKIQVYDTAEIQCIERLGGIVEIVLPAGSINTYTIGYIDNPPANAVNQSVNDF